MSERLRLDDSGLEGFLREEDIFGLREEVARCHRMLFDKSSPGGDFLGWVDLPSRIDSKVLRDIQDTAASLRHEAEALVVIGIGGSYLGARAVIEAFTNRFSPSLPIYYAGHHLDGAYHRDLLKHLEGKRFAIDVISKSGTTTEPAIAFRLFRALLEKNVGRESARRLIVATTDARKGALRTLADQEGYRTFVVPDDVGGRYSVLTPVGLLPIAAAGIDVEALARGAKDFQSIAREPDLKGNPAAFYAAAGSQCPLPEWERRSRFVGRTPIRRLACFGESVMENSCMEKAKAERGQAACSPAACHFTTDLHSMGQWIQEGERSIFEDGASLREGSGTEIRVEKDAEGTWRDEFSGGVGTG
jgi:glucose-6-phosphate isomerase